MTRLNHEWNGDASLPVLVFSHALGADLSMWESQIAELSRSFRILRFDTRGHGKSDVPPGPYTADELAADVVALFDRLGLEQVNFCGLSMGGMIGQCLGLRYPERVRRLVLANTAARFGSHESWNARIQKIEQDGLSSVASTVVERWLTPPYRALHPDLFERFCERMIATDPSGYLACCVALRDVDLSESLSKIGVPTLVITGTHDPATPPSDGQLIADRVPGAEYVELPCAHLSNVECAGLFNHELVTFLE